MDALRSTRSARVVFVNRYFHPDESATSRLLSDLAFRLARGGVQVAIVTSRQLYEDPHAALPARQTLRGVMIHRVATFARGRASLAGRALDYLSFHVAAGLKLLAILQPGDVVVAKTDPPLIGVVSALAARRRGALLVNWLQDLFPEVALALMPGAMPRWLQAALTGLRDRGLRAAQVNVVIGEGMRERLLARGVAADRIRVMPNWTDPHLIAPMAAQRSQTRSRLDLQARFVIGYSGNFGRAHEFRTLLDAARRLQDDPRFAFLMTGGGARYAELRAAAAAVKLQSFHFQGYQSAALLADSLAAADVHLVSLLPALEGLILPSKLYGILAAGRPVVFIGDTRGEVARMLREQSCGISVEVGAGESLADELRALQSDPVRLQNLGANARRLALTHYSSDIAAASWLGLLAQNSFSNSAPSPP
jgi:colanic acid biosynthesis glycosyl transferase WcaI